MPHILVLQRKPRPNPQKPHPETCLGFCGRSLTKPSFELFFVNITTDLSFSSRRSGERQPRLRCLIRTSLPLSSISKDLSSPSIFPNSIEFIRSTSSLWVKSLVIFASLEDRVTKRWLRHSRCSFETESDRIADSNSIKSFSDCRCCSDK